MEARIKRSCRYGHVRAFGGVIYTRIEWKRVPVGCEEEAKVHPYLDIREMLEKPVVESMVEPLEGLEVIKATPQAKKLAGENGIDLATVHGSGKDGMITVGDIKSLLEG